MSDHQYTFYAIQDSDLEVKPDCDKLLNQILQAIISNQSNLSKRLDSFEQQVTTLLESYGMSNKDRQTLEKLQNILIDSDLKNQLNSIKRLQQETLESVGMFQTSTQLQLDNIASGVLEEFGQMKLDAL